MLGAFISNIPRRFRLFGLVFFIALLAYILWAYFGAERLIIPREFLEAKGRGAAVAGEIVRLSRESAERLARISELDEEENYVDALNLVAEELNRNRDIRERAVELSNELSLMTSAVTQISEIEARAAALMAVNSEVALISKLLSYNEYLYQLLQLLDKKFQGLSPGPQSVNELVSRINEEAAEINALNEQFLAEIEKLERAAN